jgi:endonuclease G, mitochondrial
MTEVPTAADAPCADMTFAGFPRQEKTKLATHFICRGGYALNFEASARTAQWVTQRLRAQDIDERLTRRQEDFRPDPELEGWSPKLEYYQGSGYDRGHLAPADDFREDPVKMSHSFYLSNMVPQNPAMNRGVWSQLEKVTRGLAKARGEVFVITGPIYSRGQNLGMIGWEKGRAVPPPLRSEADLASERPVLVPTHLYKVVLDPKAGQVWAFVVPNADVPGPITRYRVPVATIEQETGLRFFPQLPLQQQAKLKTVVMPLGRVPSDQVSAPPQ